jgi:hypothetical protein
VTCELLSSCFTIQLEYASASTGQPRTSSGSRIRDILRKHFNEPNAHPKISSIFLEEMEEQVKAVPLSEVDDPVVEEKQPEAPKKEPAK